MTKPPDIALRNWLKELIISLSEGDVSAFAKRYKLDRPSLSLMVNGKRKVSEKMVYRISSRTGRPVPKGMQPLVEESNILQHVQPLVAPRVAPPDSPSRTEELLERLLKAQEEQALLIRTLTELVMERTRKD